MKKLINKKSFSVKSSVWNGESFIENITEYEVGTEFWGYPEYHFIVGYDGNKPIKELSNYVVISVAGHSNLIFIEKNIFEN